MNKLFLHTARDQEMAALYMPCHSCKFDLDITGNSCTAGKEPSVRSGLLVISSHRAQGAPCAQTQ